MRSGYTDDCEGSDLAMWRGRVASSIRGKRGQALLHDCLRALDVMPVKRLIANELVDGNEVCLLGAVAQYRVVDLDKIDPEEHGIIGEKLNISPCMVQEIEFENDEARSNETPEQRFERMRKWVVRNLKDGAK